MTSGVKTFRLLVKRFDASKGRRATAVSTLGEYPGVTLAEARRQAYVRAGRVAGAAERLSVAGALERFFAAHETGAHAWRPNTCKTYAVYRNALAGDIGARPLTEVKRHELADLFRRYAARGPVAGNRLADFAASFWRWSQGEGLTETDLTAQLGAKQRPPGGEERSRERVRRTISAPCGAPPRRHPCCARSS
jgi:hypothetical protein